MSEDGGMYKRNKSICIKHELSGSFCRGMAAGMRGIGIVDATGWFCDYVVVWI